MAVAHKTEGHEDLYKDHVAETHCAIKCAWHL